MVPSSSETEKGKSIVFVFVLRALKKVRNNGIPYLCMRLLIDFIAKFYCVEEGKIQGVVPLPRGEVFANVAFSVIFITQSCSMKIFILNTGLCLRVWLFDKPGG